MGKTDICGERGCDFSCEKLKGGFLFESNEDGGYERRMIVGEIDAITICCSLLHGELLSSIKAHEEIKRQKKEE